MEFLEACPAIRESGIAVNVSKASSRTGVATIIPAASGRANAAVTVVGPTSQVLPRVGALGELLLKHVQQWRGRSLAPREVL